MKRVISPIASDPARYAAIVRDLKLELDSQIPRSDRMGRIDWLRERIGVYFDRWIGMAAHFPISAVLQNDLHTMLRIGIHLIDGEVRGLEIDAVAASWQAFTDHVSELSDASPPAAVTWIAQLFEAFSREVEAVVPQE